jgi:spore germination protein GerM
MAALIDTPEAANRLARAIASDLSLYNEAKIKEGIENDTFFSVLQEEIAEGRAHYESRVDPKLLGSTNFFDRALVDVILARKGHIKSKIW